MAADQANTERELRELIGRALAEDIGPGDLTAEAVVESTARARGRIVQKQPGVFFGLAAARMTFGMAGGAELDALMVEGQWRHAVPAEIALVSGPARALLAAERTALNLLGHLSGIATQTARFVEAVAGSRCQILDTRKTTPGLRSLEKAAVRTGGGRNHRMGLYDAILIKENHAIFVGGVAAAIERARLAHPGLPVEVECRDREEVAAALATGVERILLDNMDLDGLRAAVEARGALPTELEASGGVSLDNVAAIAQTGIDYISIGALTQSAPALDLSLLIEPA